MCVCKWHNKCMCVCKWHNKWSDIISIYVCVSDIIRGVCVSDKISKWRNKSKISWARLRGGVGSKSHQLS